VLLGDIPRSLAEPNVAVSPAGTATFEAVGEPGCDLDVDLGVCPPGFTGLHPQGLVGNGDGDVAFAPNGTLWWLGLAARDAWVPLQPSHDNGTTWGPAQDVANGEHSDREWIDMDGNGTVRMVWSQFEGQPLVPYTVYRRWDPDVPTPTVHLPGSDRLKGPLVHANGTLYVPQVSRGGVWLSVSHDDGATWDDLQVANLSSARNVYPGSPAWVWPVAAADAAGNLYVTWAVEDAVAGMRPARDAAAPLVHLATSRDGGATWTTTTLSAPLHTGIFPWVVAGSAGRIAVAWYESVSPAASETLPSLWDVRLVESADAHSSAPTFLSGKANRDPVHIGLVCTSGGGCEGRDRTHGDFFEMAIAPDGLPVLAWAGDSPTRVQHVQVWFGGLASGVPLT
jgi:hypothetical protein